MKREKVAPRKEVREVREERSAGGSRGGRNGMTFSLQREDEDQSSGHPIVRGMYSRQERLATGGVI